jgi:hypothetical protein
MLFLQLGRQSATGTTGADNQLSNRVARFVKMS